MSALPRGWSSLTLADAVQNDAPIIYGILQPGPDIDRGVPYVRPTEIQQGRIVQRELRRTSREIAERYRRSTLAADDLILSIVGTIGKVAVVPQELEGANITQSSCRIRADKQICERDWMKYFLVGPLAGKHYLDNKLGTAVPRLNLEDVRQFILPLPPLAEQKRIVAKLDALSAKSARAHTELARIETLVSRYKQAVLSKAFSGELTAAEASEREYSGSPMAPIYPVHWRVMQLGGIADIKSGITLGKKRNADELLVELPYLRVANVQRGWLDLGQIKTVQVTAKEAEALYLREGDVLMNEGGDRDKLGRGWVWEGQIPDCIHQNHVFRVRLALGSVPPRFLSYYANEFGQKHFFDEGKQTTNLASISKAKLSAMQIPVPPYDEATEIVRRIESAFAKIDRLAIEAKRARKLLGKLDEAILAKAFRGELVPQDENDEPAGVLLQRIRQGRAAEPSSPKRRVFPTKGKGHDMTRTIIEALADAKDWLAAQELFARCGVRDGSSTEDVEKLYSQLLDLERQDRIEIDEMLDPATGAKQGNRVRLRK